MIILLSVLFVLYGIIYIINTSVVLFDGHRYFILFDDAMISMRYAWNFSHGQGLYWNPGDRVEGYTNPLMTIIMSVATFFFDKINSVLVIQLFGIATVLGVAFASRQLAGELYFSKPLTNQKLARTLAFILPFCYYPLVYWTLLGMETGLLTLLLVCAVFVCFRYTGEKANWQQLYLLPGLAGLAFLTRPDALLVGGLTLAYYAYEIWFKTSLTLSAKITRLVRVGAVYSAIILAQEAFRWFYYGDLVPNTFILKATGMSWSDRISNGWGFIVPFLIESLPIILLSIVALLFNFSLRKIFLFSLFTAIVLYQISVGGDPWNYWRILVPGMAMLFPLVSTLVAESYVKLIIPASKKYVKYLFAMAVVAILLMCNSRFLGEITLTQQAYQVEANTFNVEKALLIEQFIKNDKVIIGMFWAGTVPYYTGLPTMDFLGKSDKKIAQLPPDMSGAISWDGMKSVPGHNKYDLEYSIKELQPDFIEDYKWGQQNLKMWSILNYYTIYLNGQILNFRRFDPNIDWPKLYAIANKNCITNCFNDPDK